MKSLKSKLTIAFIAVCFVVIMMIWAVLSLSFAETYYAATQLEIATTLEKAVNVLDDSEHTFDDETIDEISEYMSQGFCIEVADANGDGVLLLEGIGDACQLHGAKEDEVFSDQRRLNTDLSKEIREEVQANESYNQDLIDDYGNTQILRGKLTDMDYSVIVSTNLARTDSIVGIVSNQITIITFFAIILAFIISSMFATNFTRPIAVLSKAAKEIAKGNYRVKLKIQEGKDDEIVQLAKDFNTMVEEIESTQEMQKDLIANISHDLRTPLTIIKGYAESIKDITGDNKEMRENQLETIIDETDRLSLMVASVLEYSKLNQKTYKLNVVQYDIAEMLKDIVDFYSYSANVDEKEIVYEGLESAFIFADASLIERVLHNFVSNALLHTSKGENIVASVTNLEDGKIKVSIKDFGDGIAKEDIKHIFDRYYRSRKDTGKQGTGLGLTIVKSILENHGFEYGVESDIGKGSEFYFIV